MEPPSPIQALPYKAPGLYGYFSDRYLGLKNSTNTRHQNFLTCLRVLGIFGLLRGNPASFISAVVLSPESP